MKATQPDHSTEDSVPPIQRHTLVWLALGVVILVGVVFIIGFFIRHERITKREKMAKDIREEPLVVQVVQPKETQKSFEVTLPADVQAYATTALYARTNGFLASWTADINDRVHKGQVLAVISAPGTDAELEQAEANLNQQKTNFDLATATENRYQGLIESNGVTQQQLDQLHSTKEQAKANVVSMDASVNRLKALVGFEKIVAPFDGVVTARTYDIGALISASNNGAGQQIFSLAEDDRLRVFVSVPQAYSLLIKFGQPVALVLGRNYPGHKFTGVIARSAGILDPVTRTLRTELDFKNDDPAYHIFPGMYGEAVFTIEREHAVLTVPTSALLFEANGKQVAVVEKDNKIHFVPIVPGSDFGTEIEVVSGLKGDERIVSNPNEQLAEGLAVSPKTDGDDDAPKAKAAP